MYISSCSIRSWNWNRKLTQDHFLIEHWIQRTHRCPAVRCWPWVYSLGMVSRYSTVRSETLTWREWGLWSSSHNLEIERGRHTRPCTPITDRLCPKCEVLEDEIHFLTSCHLFTTERDILFSRITTMFSDFQTLANHEKLYSCCVIRIENY